MKVKMLTLTRWEGKGLKVGDVVDVETNIAERWSKAGIASIPTKKPEETEKKG